MAAPGLFALWRSRHGEDGQRGNHFTGRSPDGERAQQRSGRAVSAVESLRGAVCAAPPSHGRAARPGQEAAPRPRNFQSQALKRKVALGLSRLLLLLLLSEVFRQACLEPFSRSSLRTLKDPQNVPTLGTVRLSILRIHRSSSLCRSRLTAAHGCIVPWHCYERPASASLGRQMGMQVPSSCRNQCREGFTDLTSHIIDNN